MNEKLKRAAAVAAVFAYIKSEEETLSMQMAMQQAAPIQPTVPAAPVKLWGVSGRQTQMNLRNMMQLRGFHR